jgi:hypothetical protein
MNNNNISIKMGERWIDQYDLETANVDFRLIQYSSYIATDEIYPAISIDSPTVIEAISQKTLFTIWQFIEKVSETESKIADESLNKKLIQSLSYVRCEYKFASTAWNSRDVNSRLLRSLLRLRNYMTWLVRENEECWTSIKSFTNRALSILIKVMNDKEEYWAKEYRELAQDIIQTIELMKISSVRRTANRFTSPGRINTYKANPTNKSLLQRTKTRETATACKFGQPVTSESLSQNKLLTAKLETPKLGVDNKVLYSIYKDSPTYKNYTSYFPNDGKDILAINVFSGLNGRRTSKQLENLLSVEMCSTGKWVEEPLLRRAPRIRQTVKPNIRWTRMQSFDVTILEEKETVQSNTEQDSSDSNSIDGKDKIDEEEVKYEIESEKHKELRAIITLTNAEFDPSRIKRSRVVDNKVKGRQMKSEIIY